MNRAMLSLQTTLPFSKVFLMVLNFHLKEDSQILDITPGERYSWSSWLYEEKKRNQCFFPRKRFSVDWIEEDLSTYKKMRELISAGNKKWDAVFFDPPYIFGLANSNDKRCQSYGQYKHSFQDIKAFFTKANDIFPKLLKSEGKLFLKSSDVFSLAERKFYFAIFHWVKAFSNFEVVDHYITTHHYINPTAWQVKNRPCGIINYTYLTVLEVKND